MIGEMTINAIGSAVTCMLLDHMRDLDQAYMAQEEGAFPINIAVKIRPCPEGNRVDLALGFVTSRVKAQAIRLINESQVPLFTKEGD
jgi:hypothetical protein